MNIETKAATEPSARPVTPPTQKPRPARPVTWFRPTVDVWENEDGLTLILDVPGVAPDTIEIRAEGPTLTVQGVRVDRERGWHRVFTLPSTIDPAGITAKSENGVLTLSLPRAEAAKPRRIEVH